jgi:hypothetical protein
MDLDKMPPVGQYKPKYNLVEPKQEEAILKGKDIEPTFALDEKQSTTICLKVIRAMMHEGVDISRLAMSQKVSKLDMNEKRISEPTGDVEEDKNSIKELKRTRTIKSSGNRTKRAQSSFEENPSMKKALTKKGSIDSQEEIIEEMKLQNPVKEIETIRTKTTNVLNVNSAYTGNTLQSRTNRRM